jgi:multiple sugar transport system substrate-binding protein
MASVGGRAPDLAVMHLTRVFGYAPGGLLDPWDIDRLASMGITEDKFQPALWERAFVGDKMYALPLDFHAFVQFFNTDICDQAGVLDGNGRLVGVDSPDGYVEVGREVAKVTGQQGISYGYTSDGAQMSRMFWGLYHQTGANIILTPGEQAVFDTDAAAEVIKFVQSWLDDSIALRNQDYGSSLASFSNQRSGLNWNGNWEVATFKAAELPLGAMSCPQIFDRPGTYGDAHSFVLPHQSVVDEERREAAYRIAAGMLQNSLDWAQGGHIPAFKDVVNSPEYQAIRPQSDYADAMENPVFDPQAWFTGSGSTFQGTFGVPIQEAWLNSADPGKTAMELKDILNAALQTQPPA